MATTLNGQTANRSALQSRNPAHVLFLRGESAHGTEPKVTDWQLLADVRTRQRSPGYKRALGAMRWPSKRA
jgi:hypothetical protein